MGIAANVCKRGFSSNLCLKFLFNRTLSKAKQHALDFGTKNVSNLTDLNDIDVDVVITCLPTSTEVANIVGELVGFLKSGVIWIDCTSGDPNKSKEIETKLKSYDISFVDCAVSGGPCGASSGELSAMVGSDNFDCVLPFISLFAQKKIVHCGNVGSGHAVKAINNALNAAHLILGAEALIALRNFDIDSGKAQAINASSDVRYRLRTNSKRSLNHNFNYGFKLGLMAKDVKTASVCLKVPRDSMLHKTHTFLTRALCEQGGDVDYTELVKILEYDADVKLHF